MLLLHFKAEANLLMIFTWILSSSPCLSLHLFNVVETEMLLSTFLIGVSLQTGPIPLQYLVKPTRKRRRPSQSTAQGHSDGVNTSPASESDSQSDKVPSPAGTQPPRASLQSSPASQDLSAAIQSSNGTINTPRHGFSSKQGANTRKVTVNGMSSEAAKEEVRGSDKSGLPPTT